MSENSFLFVVNGLGLGNAVRCSQLIEECVENGNQVSVAASGNALEWFRAYYKNLNLIELDQPTYPRSVFGCLTALLEFIKVTYRNRLKLLQLIEQLKPYSVIIDSFYGLTRYDLGVPLIAINNSDYVVSNFTRREILSLCALPHFLFVEVVDAVFHTIAVTKIISPHFDIKELSISGRFIFIPPLIRSMKDDNLETELKSTSDKLNICILLSGSSTLHFDPKEYLHLPVCFHIIGKEGDTTSNEIYYGKVQNPLPLLMEADLLIIGGGFLSCAEALFINKPTIVMPLPWHAEQQVNAYKLHELLGAIIAKESDLKDILSEEALNRILDIVNKAGGKEKILSVFNPPKLNLIPYLREFT